MVGDGDGFVDETAGFLELILVEIGVGGVGTDLGATGVCGGKDGVGKGESLAP